MLPTGPFDAVLGLMTVYVIHSIESLGPTDGASSIRVVFSGAQNLRVGRASDDD